MNYPYPIATNLARAVGEQLAEKLNATSYAKHGIQFVLDWKNYAPTNAVLGVTAHSIRELSASEVAELKGYAQGFIAGRMHVPLCPACGNGELRSKCEVCHMTGVAQ